MLKPCGHRVLIKEEEIKTESDGGILLAVDDKIERANQTTGTIVDYGFQAWKAFDHNQEGNCGKPWAQVGDRILFSKYAGKIIEDPDTKEQFKIINDEDIIAVIQEDTENV